jgi:hypothetical protein
MKRILGCLAILSIIIAAQSCNEKTVIGSSLVPKVDNVNTFSTDSVTMTARNVWYDSAITSTYTSTNRYYALGCINGGASGDPVFGKTVASMALQFQQEALNLSFVPDLIVDSLVLSMPFIKAYGDTINGTTQTINVFQLSDSLSKDTNYTINRQLNYNSTKLLGSAAINFRKMSSLHLPEGDKLPQLRIALDTNLARQLINLRDTVEYKTYPSFIKWFKGLYISPADTNSGNMLGYFDYNQAIVRMYTHTKTNPKTIINTFGFVGTNCVHHNRIARNYSDNNPLIKNYLNGTNPKGDSILFLQSDGGSTIEITFPYLAQMQNAVVNKAELEFTVISTGDNLKDQLFRPITLLRATGINTSQVDYLLTGDYTNSTNGITKIINDGFKKTEYINGNEVIKYRLTLTKTIQQALSTQDNTLKIRIIGLNGLLGSGRSFIGGTNRIAQKAKINLIYTKIK